MFLDARSMAPNTRLETDVCIVGAGPAGITLAREFIGAPVRVCLLESGGFISDEDTRALAAGHNIGLPYRALDQARSRRFGGTTDQWAGTCRPLDEVDFEPRAWVPHSGWPLKRTDLEPYYRRAQTICGVGPFAYDLDDWIARSGLRPLPLLGDRVTTTVVQFSAPTRFGTTYRRQLSSATNITTLLHANAVVLETNETARQVTSVQVACLGGPRFSVAPKLVILAAGGIENARLLLLSNTVQPNGLGNQHDLVGRFFMEHPHVESGTILPAHPYLPSRLYKKCRVNGTIIMGLLTLSDEVQRREQLLNYSALLIPEEVSAGMEAVKRLYRAFRGRTMPDALWRDVWCALRETSVADVARAGYGILAKGQLPLRCFRILSRTEQSPNADSRVTLGPDVDALGQRRAQLDWRLSALDKQSIRRALAIIGQEVRRAGLGDLHGELDGDDLAWPTPPGSGGHHIGTTRMHEDPRQGVVDPCGRVHGISNLFVAGSSVFPTAGHANPTLTLVALAMRLAEHVKGCMAAGEDLGQVRVAAVTRKHARPSRKLLWVGVLPPHPGGAAVSGFQTLVGLARAGHTIRSLAPLTPEMARAGDSFAARHPELGITRFPVPYFETSPHTPAAEEYRQLEQDQVERQLVMLIERERPDIVLLGRETFAWRVPDVARRYGLPCVLRIAGGFLAGVVDGNYGAPLIAQWLEQVRKVDFIVAQTTSVKASLAALGLERIRIVPNGVDLELFAPGPGDATLRRELGVADDRVVVMHVSNLKPIKRALDIVESAARALELDPRLLYVVVGDGLQRRAMEEACARRGISEHFRFTGWVQYERVPAYLKLADLVLMPSESEAQARVYLETQACARTLLASDVAGARHVIEDGHTGLLFRKGDIEDLTAKTLLAAADPGLRTRIGGRARQRVATHSLDVIAAGYTELIEEAIAAPGRPSVDDRRPDSTRTEPARLPPRRNIIYVGSLPPHPGGSAISGSQLIISLARQGHRVRAVAPVTTEGIPAGEAFAARHPEIGITRFLLPYFETSSYSPPPEEHRRHERAQLEGQLERLIAEERPDVLFVGRETFAWHVPDIAERHGLPCLLRLAGGLTQGVLDGVYPEALARRALQQFGRFDTIVSQARYMTERLRGVGCTNLRTIPNAIDTERFQPREKNIDLRQALGITPGAVVVFHASNMKALKRPLDIVASAGLALARHPGLVYLIVGDGQCLQAMKEACQERGIADHFRFVGWVAYEQMPSYLSLADIVVMPSETEMQARMYLETQASGRVLLASDIPGAREVVEDGESGLLFRKGDAEDLAAKTLLAAGDAQLRQEIGHKGRERVMSHSLEQATAAYAAAIEDILRRRHGRA